MVVKDDEVEGIAGEVRQGCKVFWTIFVTFFIVAWPGFPASSLVGDRWQAKYSVLSCFLSPLLGFMGLFCVHVTVIRGKNSRQKERGGRQGTKKEKEGALRQKYWWFPGVFYVASYAFRLFVFVNAALACFHVFLLVPNADSFFLENIIWSACAFLGDLVLVLLHCLFVRCCYDKYLPLLA